MRTRERKMVVVFALLLGMFVSMPAFAAKKSKLSTVKVTIGGMSCGGCAARITSLLKNVKGVKKARVSFEKKLAVVSYDGSLVKAKVIVAAVKKAGYKASTKSSCASDCKCKKKKKCKDGCGCKECKAKKGKVVKAKAKS